MRIAPLADVKARLSAYLDECGDEGPLVITRNGKPAAVLLVPEDDDDLERLLVSRSRRFQALLNRSRKSIKEGKGLSETDFWAAVHKRAQSRQKTTSRTVRRAAANYRSSACLPTRDSAVGRIRTTAETVGACPNGIRIRSESARAEGS